MSSTDSNLFAPKRKHVTCCVTPCVVPQVNNCSFHSFPSEVDVRSKWQKALSLDVIDDGMKVCSGHFCSEDFFPACAFKVRKLNVKRLKRTAVPSLYLPSALREEDALRIVKVESFSSEFDSEEMVDSSTKKSKFDDCPLSDNCEAAPKNGVKTEPGSVAPKDQFSIETFCCTTCGLILNSEPLFLEHLGTHVKEEKQNFYCETEEDPLGACLPDDSEFTVADDDASLSAEGSISAEGTVTAESTEGTLTAESIEGTLSAEESWENDDDDFDGASDEEEDEEFQKLLSSDNKFFERTKKIVQFFADLISNSKEHMCFICKRGSRNIELHLTTLHTWHPAVQDVLIHRSRPHLWRRGLRLRRLILVGDYFAKNKADRIVQSFSRIRNQESFQNFMRCRLTRLDERLRDYIFDLYLKRLRYSLAKEGLDNVTPFSEQRLFQGDGVHSASLKKRKFTCLYCDFNSDNRTLAVAHLHLHSEGKTFGCQCCQRFFDSFESLLSTHTTGHTCSSIRPTNFQLRCDYCWTFFSNRKEYVWHVMYGYCLSLIITCEWCGIRLVRRHMMTHTMKVHPVIKMQPPDSELKPSDDPKLE